MGTSRASVDVVGWALNQTGSVRGENDCATFVSDAYAAGCKLAGVPNPLRRNSWVAGLVNQFPKSAVSSDLATANQADLIVFGDEEHVMLWVGSGNKVVGTCGGQPTTGVWPEPASGTLTKVVEIDYTEARTNHYGASPPPVKVVHVGLAQPGDVVSGVTDAVTTAAGGLFGAMFGWVPGLAANGAVLALIVWLAVTGIRQLLDSAE